MEIFDTKVYDTFLYIISSFLYKYKQMSKTEKGFANQIMVGYNSLKQPKTLYIPAYLSAKINNIQSLVVADSIGTINLTLYLQLYFGNLSGQFVDRCCEQIQLGPSRDDQFKVKLSKKLKKIVIEQQAMQDMALQSKEDQQQQQEETVNIVQKKFDEINRTKVFVMRKSFQASLISYSYFTPFEIHDLALYFETRKIMIQKNDLRLEVKLNFMSTYRFDSKILKCLNFTEAGSFGQYQLAETFLMYENPAQRPKKSLNELFNYFPLSKSGIKPILPQKKHLNKLNQVECLQHMSQYLDLKNFQYASFHFPMYRKPLVGFLTIFLPLWALSFITLSLYFSGNSYAKRVIAIATLNLAFVPTVQLVRQSIPQTPKFTFVELFIYMEIISACVLLLQSNKISGQTEFTFVPFQDNYFLVSLIFSIFVFILPIIWAIIFLCVYESQLNIATKSQKDPEQIQKDQNNQKQKIKKYCVNQDKKQDNQQKEKLGKQKEDQGGFKFDRNQWSYNQEANHYFYEKKRLYSAFPNLQQKIIQLKKQINQKTEKKQGIDNAKFQKLKLPYKYFITENSQNFEYEILIKYINNMMLQNKKVSQNKI